MEIPNKENLCKRCGLCCHDKLKINDTVYIFLNSPCPHLTIDEKNKFCCSDYEKRCELKDVECLSLEDAIKQGVLPADCGYKEYFPKDYKPAVTAKHLRDLRKV